MILFGGRKGFEFLSNKNMSDCAVINYLIDTNAVRMTNQTFLFKHNMWSEKYTPCGESKGFNMLILSL
jgi:hypothetical protein